MSGDWKDVSLGDICDFKGGGTPSKEVDRFWQGDIPWVSPKDMKSAVVLDSIDHITQEAVSESATSIVDPGSVLMVVRSGILARTVPIAVAGRPLAINQDLKALCPRPCVGSAFLYYLLMAKMPELLALVSKGATVHRLVTDQVREIRFRLPEATEQRRIVAILDEAFEAIATAKSNTERVLECSLEWQDRVIAQVLEESSANQEPMHLASLVASGCSLSYGIVQPGSEVEGGVPVVRPTDLTRRHVGIEGVKRIDPLLARGYVRTKLEGGELLLCVRGSTGVVSIADAALAGGNVTRGIVPIRFDTRAVSQDLGYYLLRSEAVQAEIRAKTYGTALMQINIADVRRLSMRVPPVERQAEIVAKLDSIQHASEAMVSVSERKLSALDELKQSLLHQAFTGQLTARSADEQVSEVA